MDYSYETHPMADPMLPFIYHREKLVCQRHSPPNWHENMELLWCLEGEGTVRCGSRELDFRPGDVLVIGPDSLHYIASQTRVRYRCLIIETGFLESNGLVRPNFQPQIRDESLFAQCEAVARAFQTHQSLEIRYQVLGLVRLLWRDYARDGAQSGVPNDYVKKALIYIRRNLAQPMTLDEIADHVGITKFHLARQFRTYTGKTVVQTINLLRCNEARHRMEEGMLASQAARACGYDNISYFTRTFHRLFGILPSACLEKSSPSPEGRE